MNKIIIYHGSNIEVIKPKILSDGFYKDFGYGFYCTKYEKQAKRWALTRNGNSVVNRYSYIGNNKLKIKTFPDMSDEWLDFVAECRHGKSHVFDIVEGPMADDQIWNYVEDYLEGQINRKAF